MKYKDISLNIRFCHLTFKSTKGLNHFFIINGAENQIQAYHL